MISQSIISFPVLSDEKRGLCIREPNHREGCYRLRYIDRSTRGREKENGKRKEIKGEPPSLSFEAEILPRLDVLGSLFEPPNCLLGEKKLVAIYRHDYHRESSIGTCALVSLR